LVCDPEIADSLGGWEKWDVHWFIYGNALAMTGLQAEAPTCLCISRKRIEDAGNRPRGGFNL
jgi:hypothetical protein